jgi:YD repeat-containing protein
VPGRGDHPVRHRQFGDHSKGYPHFYNRAPAYNAPPEGCEETQTKAWIEGTTYAGSTASFDAYGNLDTVIDPELSKTQHLYDSAFHLFETLTRLPKYFPPESDPRFVISQYWDSDGVGGNDFRCEMPSKITNINGQDTVRVFDTLCRVTLETRPGGDYTATDYGHLPNPGDRTDQYVETRRPAPHPQSDDDDWSNPATINGLADQISQTSYLDGFGREWKKLAEGPTAAKTIEVDRVFNERGLLKSESAPYYVSVEPRKDESYNYDGLDRLIEQKHPDNEKITLTHDVSDVNGEVETVLVTDEANRQEQRQHRNLGREHPLYRPVAHRHDHLWQRHEHPVLL